MYTLEKSSAVIDLNSLLEIYHPQSYMTSEDCKDDYIKGNQYIFLDNGKPVACFTLEESEDEQFVHFKRFSILGDNFGNGYFQKSIQLTNQKFNDRISITVRSTNYPNIKRLADIGFTKQGTVGSARTKEIYDIYMKNKGEDLYEI